MKSINRFDKNLLNILELSKRPVGTIALQTLLSLIEHERKIAKQPYLHYKVHGHYCTTLDFGPSCDKLKSYNMIRTHFLLQKDLGNKIMSAEKVINSAIPGDKFDSKCIDALIARNLHRASYKTMRETLQTVRDGQSLVFQ